MSKKPNEIAKKLGADRILPIRTQPGGPLSWLQLGEEVQDRLRSRGGRPSDPRWALRRQVPFQKEVWNFLKEQAKIAQKEQGTLISPGQLAAILLERQVELLKQSLEQEGHFPHNLFEKRTPQLWPQPRRPQEKRKIVHS